MKKTRFNNIHRKLGAKLIEFAGFEMPVQYSSIIAEHKAVRTSAGLFDVSHMGEVFVRGSKALSFIQEITINDASRLAPGQVQYSAMCYTDGGIVDDLLVYMLSESEFMLVINASNTEKDFAWMQENNSGGAELVNLSDDYSLLALQGPYSGKILEKITDENPGDLEYYHFKKGKIAGTDMIISRTGYTGELGYELYFTGDDSIAEKIWNRIFDAGKDYGIVPAGLAARDSLRLEMGFCLYGNDIDQTTNPLEAGLGWITKFNKENFIGKDALLEIKSRGLKRKLSALISSEKAFPRHGYQVKVNGGIIGTITSGTVSPVLEKPIALAYIEKKYSEPGSRVNMLIRDKEIPAEVVKLPFVKK